MVPPEPICTGKSVGIGKWKRGVKKKGGYIYFQLKQAIPCNPAAVNSSAGLAIPIPVVMKLMVMIPQI